MRQIMWQYWDQDAGVPKGFSKTHIVDEDHGGSHGRTLCGIIITTSLDIEHGDGSGGHCKKCEKKEEVINGA